MSVIDEYLADVTPTQKTALEHIRKTVKQHVPDAEEVISYGMPTFKYRGKPLLHIAAFKDHLSVFPTADPKLLKIDGLATFQTSKGTLQFTEDNPIPDTIIKEIVEVRIESINDEHA